MTLSAYNSHLQLLLGLLALAYPLVPPVIGVFVLEYSYVR